MTSSSDDSLPCEIELPDIMQRWGLTARAVRFYEVRGLLSPRRRGRIRIYTLSDAERVGLILQAKRLGFTLTEIRDVLSKAAEGNQLRLTEKQCLRQIAFLEAELIEKTAALAELRAILAQLQCGPI